MRFRNPARQRSCRAPKSSMSPACRAQRIMSTTIAVGTRLPAFHTSLGRAQLGFLDEDEVWRRLKTVRVEPYTPSTITDLAGAGRAHQGRPCARLLDRRRGAGARPCARSPCRSSREATVASARSTSPPIPAAPPATRCATISCLSFVLWRNRFHGRSLELRPRSAGRTRREISSPRSGSTRPMSY